MLPSRPSRIAILVVVVVSKGCFVLVTSSLSFNGDRASILRYVAEWGIAHRCLFVHHLVCRPPPQQHSQLLQSASPKSHPLNPGNIVLQFSESYVAEVALHDSLLCSADIIVTKSCATINEKLHCNIEEAALQESGAFLPDSRLPRLGIHV